MDAGVKDEDETDWRNEGRSVWIPRTQDQADRTRPEWR
jgi:hypothetical protein